MTRLLVMVAAAGLLTACASGPTIVANTSPDADFRQFQTFGFMDQLGTDRSSGVRTPLSTMLMAAASQEMAARGLTRSDDPDLLIDFMVFTEDRMDVRQTPTSTVHRSNWHRGFTTWPAYQTTVRQYTQGSLIIDLIDPRANRLIAEGSAQNRLSNTEFSQEQINDIVGQVLSGIWAN